MVTQPQYVEQAILPTRSPNGVLWMIRGHLLYQRIGSHHHFMVMVLGRRYMFGFGSRS